MHRNGIALDELDVALPLIKEQELNLVVVMTHFRSADELSSELFWQQKNFEVVKKEVIEAGYEDIRFHSHNSVTILRTNSFDEDLLRVGIGAYGYNELPACIDKTALKPIMALYAKKVTTRVLKRGQRVGYGGDFTASKDMTISTYDLGYGDGWCRGDVCNPYITAECLPILGRVSMDSISLQTEKEVVCVMSDAQAAARQFGTISYEVTTGLMPNIEKIDLMENNSCYFTPFSR